MSRKPWRKLSPRELWQIEDSQRRKFRLSGTVEPLVEACGRWRSGAGPGCWAPAGPSPGPEPEPKISSKYLLEVQRDTSTVSASELLRLARHLWRNNQRPNVEHQEAESVRVDIRVLLEGVRRHRQGRAGVARVFGGEGIYLWVRMGRPWLELWEATLANRALYKLRNLSFEDRIEALCEYLLDQGVEMPNRPGSAVDDSGQPLGR